MSPRSLWSLLNLEPSPVQRGRSNFQHLSLSCLPTSQELSVLLSSTQINERRWMFGEDTTTRPSSHKTTLDFKGSVCDIDFRLI